MTKKTLFFLLLAALIIFPGCAVAGAAHLPKLEPGQELLQAGARQFGKPDAIMEAEGDFSYTIIYPKCGVADIDAAISQWAVQTLGDIRGIKYMSAEDMLGGSLVVNYDAYYAHDRFISIVEKGVYTGVGGARVVDVLKTFIYDLQEERFLTAVDFIPYALHPSLFTLIEGKMAQVAPGVPAQAFDVDSTWVYPMAVTPEGIELALAAGSLAARAGGIDSISFGYDELDGLFALPGDAAEETTRPPEEATQPPDIVEEVPPGDVLQQTYPLDPEKPTIALTFDDGPSKVTAQMLELLEQYNIPATFFMIGRQVEEYSDTVAQMAAQGCEVASHTWDHPNLSRQTAEGMEKQLTDTADAIEAACGVRPVLVRPPYGEASKAVRAQAGAMGLYLINWSVDTLDWQSRDAEAVYQHIMGHVKDGYIILCHDIYQSTYDAMVLAIPALLEQGYQFVTVSQLLGMEDGLMTPGVIYRHK